MKSVIVTWHDAYTIDAWSTRAEIQDKLKAQPRGEPSRSSSFLLEENEFGLVLVQSEQPEHEVTEATFAGLLFIPRGMIVDVEVLKE